MNQRSSGVLIILWCTTILSISACTTTTQRLGPNQAAMNHHGLVNGDMVLIRYANKNDARSSSSSEKIQITGINESGISGTDENGVVVNADYDEIFQIEYIKVGPIKSDSPALSNAAKAAEVTSKALFAALYIAACAYGGGC